MGRSKRLGDDFDMPAERKRGGSTNDFALMTRNDARLLASIVALDPKVQAADAEGQLPWISSLCKKAKHHECTSRKCTCDCGHGL